MKLKRLSSSLLFLIFLSTIFSIPTPFGANYLPWPDFSKVTPITVDTVGDETPDYDITSCRATYDSNFIYFNIRVQGSIHPESIFIWMDTDLNSATGDKSGALGQHNLGAEYYLHPVQGASVIAYLYEWRNGTWAQTKSIDMRRDEKSIDIAVSRSDIRNPTKINILFASVTKTDYAPDKGFVSLNVPISGPGEPEASWVSIMAPYIFIAVAVLTVIGVALILRRRSQSLS